MALTPYNIKQLRTWGILGDNGSISKNNWPVLTKWATDNLVIGPTTPTYVRIVGTTYAIKYSLSHRGVSIEKLLGLRNPKCPYYIMAKPKQLA